MLGGDSTHQIVGGCSVLDRPVRSAPLRQYAPHLVRKGRLDPPDRSHTVMRAPAPVDPLDHSRPPGARSINRVADGIEDCGSEGRSDLLTLTALHHSDTADVEPLRRATGHVYKNLSANPAVEPRRDVHDVGVGPFPWGAEASGHNRLPQ